MFSGGEAIVRAPVPRGAPYGSVAGHLAHEVPGAWLSVSMAVAGLAALARTCSDIEADQVEALQQAGLARVGHSQHSQTMLERGGAAIACGEVAQVDEELDS
jgi:hypothetical protein